MKNLDPSKIKIFGNRILIKAKESLSWGKISLPPGFSKRELRVGKYGIGEVLAIGDKVRDIHPGQFIVFNEYSVMGADDPAGIKDGEFYFINEKEIKFVMDEKPEAVFRESGDTAEARIRIKFSDKK